MSRDKLFIGLIDGAETELQNQIDRNIKLSLALIQAAAVMDWLIKEGLAPIVARAALLSAHADAVKALNPGTESRES